jgi:glycosyltransferase involved in cell wall biosynthesis
VESLRAFLERRTGRVRAVADAVDRVLCPSRFLLEKFADAGWDRGRLLHWPNGVRPLPGIERRGDPTGRPLRVGFMGSVTPWKGPDVFLAAVGLLPPLTVEAHLFGSMDARPGFAAEVQRLAKASGARVHGALAGDAVPEALAALDVLVVPSVWYENAPLVISEAFALGLPVVASRLGGMAEMVTDGKNGILFTPGDAADLARVLADLASGRPALDDLREGIPLPRTLDEDAADLLALYRELLPISGLQGGANQ